MSFRIDMDTATLSANASGEFAGKIWIVIGGISVPEQGWWDFPLVLTSWWSNAFLPLFHQESKSVDFDFMDGPYALEIARVRAKSCNLVLKKERIRGSDRTPLGTVLISDILVALQHAGNHLIQKCRAESWQNRDIDELVRAHTELLRL